MTKQRELAKALERLGISPNELDNNGEPANIVDGLFAIAYAIEKLSLAIEKRRSDQAGKK